MLSAPSILAAARAGFSDLEALVLPVGCLGCERWLRPRDEADVCCAECRSRMRRIAPPVCGRCGQPVDTWEGAEDGRTDAPTHRRTVCAFCRSWPVELSWAASAVWLDDGPARELVHALKYGGWLVAARPMAALIARECTGRLRGVETLVPVPLARTRQRERGHNQAAVLAEALGARLGVRVITDALRRIRDTRTQTALAPVDRWHNVSGAFATSSIRLDGTTVALVDDVLTTGATLAAAATALTASGAAMIGAVTFGRAEVPQ